MPVIDYDRHPAFARGGGGQQPDPVADALVASIDAAYAEICAATGCTADSLKADYDLKVAPKIDKLLLYLSGRVRPKFVYFLTSAMQIARKVLRDDLGARDFSAAMRNDTSLLKDPFADGLSVFRKNGFFELLKADLARRVWSATIVERLLLRAQRKKIPRQHCVLALHPYSPAFRMIQRMTEECGMVDFVSAYTGKPMEFCYAALDHSHPDQTWYQDCYADIGLPTSKTVYMHTDADFDIVKSMFYLQDVGPNDGPFRFVSGSHNWRRSPLTVAVQKGFDEASREVFSGVTEHRGYYRPRFSLADHRLDLLAMPLQLRGSTHFGDDVLDGTPLSEALLDAEHSFVSPAGTWVMFDGSRGIHRGGQVQPGGSRWAVQVAFRARQGTPEKLNVLQKIKWRAGYLKHLSIKLFQTATGQ